MSKLIDLIFFKMQIFPPAIILFSRSAFNYFILDLGEDAFELPLQAMCVLRPSLLKKVFDQNKISIVFTSDSFSIGRRRWAI